MASSSATMAIDCVRGKVLISRSFTRGGEWKTINRIRCPYVICFRQSLHVLLRSRLECVINCFPLPSVVLNLNTHPVSQLTFVIQLYVKVNRRPSVKHTPCFLWQKSTFFLNYYRHIWLKPNVHTISPQQFEMLEMQYDRRNGAETCSRLPIQDLRLSFNSSKICIMYLCKVCLMSWSPWKVVDQVYRLLQIMVNLKPPPTHSKWNNIKQNSSLLCP